jgi:hypothetical protein
MFVRVKTLVQGGQRYEYLQIVCSVRDGRRVRQELVASLGRRDLLREHCRDPRNAGAPKDDLRHCENAVKARPRRRGREDGL